jgi:hypothetical protein
MAPTPTTTPAKFTLRFRNSKTHEVLGIVAERYGISKNQLAEQLLERELRAAALMLEVNLSDTLQMLQDYSLTEHAEQDIADFAEGEGYGKDPMKARMVEPAAESDPLGVLEAFGR